MADGVKLLPCPFCGGAPTKEWSDLDCRYQWCSHCGCTGPAEKTDDEAISAWNTRAAPPAMDREAVERKFWLIIREPGRLPDRKGPWPLEQTASILREFMAAHPRSFIDYLTIGPDGSPDVDHGPAVLQMADGRSMSVGRKHNARVREAAAVALSTLSADAIRQGEGIAQFGAVVFQQVWDSFIDGGWDIEVNDLITKDALKAGLVSVEPFDPKGHIDSSGAAQPGDDFYQLTDAGREAFATPDATPPSHASDGGKA